MSNYVVVDSFCSCVNSDTLVAASLFAYIAFDTCDFARFGLESLTVLPADFLAKLIPLDVRSVFRFYMPRFGANIIYVDSIYSVFGLFIKIYTNYIKIFYIKILIY